MTRIAALLLATAALVSCSKKSSPDSARLAGLCTEAGRQLTENAGSADGDTFQLMLENAIEACSAACDGDDKASCKSLDSHLQRVCKVAPDICTSFCDSAHGSLKSSACALAKPAAK
ncbi:MAG TPA: hypothetical protein VLX92_13605 [Kofleriaceae bacterium]|nr:hypothetical protein [Kofleriaceae bacterium]